MVWVVRMIGIGFKGAIGLPHPVVVEDLLHVAAAGIGHQHHDELVFVEVVLAGVFQRGEHGHAG